ncbi:hypothetical protein [Nonomuraea cavernae]|nr:hypothetical protein [Nonomuraea cavernae]MCA2184864.1 hypothetical protein [Nonomuraea cavernae]
MERLQDAIEMATPDAGFSAQPTVIYVDDEADFPGGKSFLSQQTVQNTKTSAEAAATVLTAMVPPPATPLAASTQTTPSAAGTRGEMAAHGMNSVTIVQNGPEICVPLVNSRVTWCSKRPRVSGNGCPPVGLELVQLVEGAP